MGETERGKERQIDLFVADFAFVSFVLFCFAVRSALLHNFLISKKYSLSYSYSYSFVFVFVFTRIH